MLREMRKKAGKRIMSLQRIKPSLCRSWQMQQIEVYESGNDKSIHDQNQ